MNELTTTFRVESPPAWLEIGCDAENNWRTITINCEYWFNINANGVVVLMYKPACSKPAYPLQTERSGNNIVWTPESAELVAGVGTMQAFFEVDGTTIGASKKIPCEVDGSLLGSASGGTPPWAIDVLEEIKTLTGHYPYVAGGKLYVWDSVTEQWIEFASEGGSGAVDSVNGKTGAVVLDAPDVGALPDSTVIPDVPQMATDPDMTDWTQGKTVDAAVLKGNFTYALQELSDLGDEMGNKADASDIPTAVSDLNNDSGYQTAAQMQTYVQQQIAAIPDELPAVSSSDNGKFLRVVSGAWAAQAVPFQTPRVAMTASDTTPTIDPNKLYVFPEMASLAPTLATPTDSTIVNEYHFIFESGATATVLTLPASVLQPDGFTVEANMHYEISILEGAMTAQGWAVTA